MSLTVVVSMCMILRIMSRSSFSSAPPSSSIASTIASIASSSSRGGDGVLLRLTERTESWPNQLQSAVTGVSARSTQRKGDFTTRNARVGILAARAYGTAWKSSRRRTRTTPNKMTLSQVSRCSG